MTYDTFTRSETIPEIDALLAGRYRVVRRLGQGGMGSVWLVEDTKLDDLPFAIKMLPEILVSNKRAYNQLKAEAMVSLKLVHPNIVTLRAFEENDGNPFLVMDYIDGQTLDDYLAEKGKMSEEEALRILKPVAVALDYAHLQGVVHRDVKPANVMIRKDGVPFVLDFGIAREIQETMTRVTGKLSSGTLLYMSPEQLNGAQPKKEQDVYSFAAMAYECLKGEPPFARGQIEYQIMNNPPPPLDLPMTGGKRFAASVMAGLAKNPEDRPKSCVDVLSERPSRVEPEEYVVHLAPPSAPAEPILPEPVILEPVFPRPVIRKPVIPLPNARKRKSDGGNDGRNVAIVVTLVLLAVVALCIPINIKHRNERKQRELRRVAAIRLESERQTAEAAKGRAETARIRAERADAKTHAYMLWSNAEESMRQASDDFARGNYGIAGTNFTNAADNYQLGAERAEKRRREIAEEESVTSERLAKEAREIRIEAMVQKDRLTRISDADGFKKRKEALADVFARAEASFDKKTKRWGEAVQGFSDYVKRAKELVEADGARQSAVKNRKRAHEAFKTAEVAGAKTYAVTRWNASVEIWNRADTEFDNFNFVSAGDTFASAAEQFGKCVGEANEERERQEAEARKRAEQEVRERQRRAKWRREGQQFTINEPYGLSMTMKWCPAGTFEMGSPQSEAGRLYFGEKKSDMEFQHQVTLSKGFWIGETEVTQGQWKLLMSGETVADLVRKGLNEDALYSYGGKKQPLRDIWNMSRYEDPMNRCGDLRDDVPVYNMNWHEADEFCRRLTQREHDAGRIPDGYRYRLPTEAEWEYACRAGTTATLPNGRDLYVAGRFNAPALDDIAWYGGNSSVGFGNGRGVDTSDWEEKQYPGGRAFVRTVKSKRANAWGIYDMLGNVSEWCGDWAGDYKRGQVTDPTGYVSGSCRIIRGGGWNTVPCFCRPASRNFEPPGYRFYNLGFRVALAPDH